MSVTTPIEIDCEIGQTPRFSVTMLDRSLGTLSESLEMRLQADLKAAFHKHCRRLNRDMSERIRELMAIDAYGADHVRTLIAAQLDVMGIGAHHSATPSAPADAPGAVRAG